MNRYKFFSTNQKDYTVYGAIWDKGSSPTLTKAGSMVGVTIGAGVDTTPRNRTNYKRKWNA